MKFKEQSISGALDCRIWGATARGYSFAIVHNEQLGYTASWKDQNYPGRQSSHRLDTEEQNGKTFATFEDAVAACETKLERLA